jgi:hypothetical protein
VTVAVDDSTVVMQLPLAQMLSGGGAEGSAGQPVLVRLNLVSAAGKRISSNFYWLAGKEEDMRKMNTLPQAQVGTKLTTGTDGDEKVVTAVLTNNGKQAAIELKLTLEEAEGGARILPAYYSDNYVSLLPGESRTVVIHYPESAAKGAPALGLRGFNLQQTVLPIGQ